MNLDELRSVQSKERQKDSLQNLRPSFYQEVGEYIAELEDERARVAEAADDPFSSPEVGQLTDEIETAKDVVEAIYERRMGKLVKQASLSAAGMAADDKGLTAEEADLFADLVDRIQSNKGRVLDVLEGVEAESEPQTAAEADTSPPSEAPTGEPAADSSGSEDGVRAADVMGGDPSPSVPAETDPQSSETEPPAPEPPEPSAESADDGSPETSRAPDEPSHSSERVEEPDSSETNRLTVKITEDVGSILGVDDREYTLAADDVVTLPEQNAEPLVEREAAERLE